MSSALFALGHPDLLLMPGYLVIGVLLCQAFRNTRSLVAPYAMHLAANAVGVFLLAT